MVYECEGIGGMGSRKGREARGSTQEKREGRQRYTAGVLSHAQGLTRSVPLFSTPQPSLPLHPTIPLSLPVCSLPLPSLPLYSTGHPFLSYLYRPYTSLLDSYPYFNPHPCLSKSLCPPFSSIPLALPSLNVPSILPLSSIPNPCLVLPSITSP